MGTLYATLLISTSGCTAPSDEIVAPRDRDAQLEMRVCLVGCGEISNRHAAAIRLVNARRQAASPQTRLADHVLVTAAVDPVEAAAAAMADNFRDHGCTYSEAPLDLHAVLR